VRDDAPTVAWANLVRPGRLPPWSAALLLGALALTLAAAACGARETPGRLLGPAVALGLVGPLAVLGGDAGVPPPPRWLTLALPWLFLAAYAALAGRRTGGRRVARGRARAAAVVDAAGALLVLHVGLILFTGGYSVPVAGIALTGSALALPAIGALVLAAAGVVVRHGTARPVLVRHAGILLFVLLAVAYLANGRSMGFFDTRGARYLPLSILREGDFDLDEFRPVLGGVPPAYVRVVDGRYVSGYPVGAALLALPLYVPAALGDLDPESPVAAHLEKLCAALLVASSAIFLYLAAVRLTSPGMAVLVALAYGLGTSSLSTSSQALWQHAAAQPALAAALYALVRARGAPRWIAGAGFALALAIVARPVNALLVLPLGIYAVRQHPRAVAGLLLGALPPLAFQAWYDLTYFGGLGHSRLPAGYTPWDADIWSTPLWHGLAGVLASPARGLFVYSPVLVFSVVGLAAAWRRDGDRLLRHASVGVVLLVLVYAKWRYWPGGPVFGPRLLADLTPVLALALWPLRDLLVRRAAIRLAFATALSWSVGAHAIGAFHDDWSWNQCSPYEALTDRMWSWTDNQLVNPLKRAAVTLAVASTSHTDPGQLAASYRAEAPPIVEVGNPLRFWVAATNEGRATWLPYSGGDGQLVLRWHWSRPPDPPLHAGWAPLCSDTFRGGTAAFHVLAETPREPGSYALTIGLARADRPLPDPEMSLVQTTVSVVDPVSWIRSAGPTSRLR
jgi:hypothetical protein